MAGACELPGEAEAADWLASQAWTFARSVPGQPHEYLLLRRSADPLMHLRVVRFIRERGERRPWAVPGGRGRVWCSYWPAGDLEYWTQPRDADPILNRGRKDRDAR